MEGGQHYDIMGYAREQVVGDALSKYERHRHYMHLVSSRTGKLHAPPV